jgi:Asp-tRNA(Asn)/Glu-tRNA(Gln) amidotransferase A subunit family amidase
MARPFEETLLLRVAAAYEDVSPAARRLPPMAGEG